MAGWRLQQCQSQDPDSWQDSCASQLSNISRCLVECGSLPWQYCSKKINKKNVRFPTHKYFFDRDVRACMFSFFFRPGSCQGRECPTEVVCLCWRCCACNSHWVCVVRCVCVRASVRVSVRAFPSACMVLSQGGNSSGRSLQGERQWALGVQQGLFTARAPP